MIEATGAYYEGEIKDGVPHGEGTVKLPDGQRYTGDHSEGKRHGIGELSL